MSSCTVPAVSVGPPRPTQLSIPARQQVHTTALVAVVTGALRRPAAAFAAIAAAMLSVTAITLLLRTSPVWMFRDADARVWHPGDGFDLSAGRAIVEGLEVAAAALGLVGKLRLATLTIAMLGLVLCLLHA